MELLVDPEFLPEEGVLNAEESKHCVSVMRHRVGDEVYVSNGRGVIWTCTLSEANSKGCMLNVISETVVDPRPSSLTMAVALTKNIDRFEWFAEKATEMRVERIIPLITDHSERVQMRLDRMQRVVLAAAKQSLKAWLPEMSEPMKVADLFKDKTFDNAQRFIMHCDPPVGCENKLHLLDALQRHKDSLLLIGPEGDFSAAEIQKAVSLGFKEATLGDERLRTETAAVLACHIGNLINR
ncbi:MAG: 16S rRNA (uracil(1498)-N(3))-methyltransferase [Bacteroidales bacterium]|nr:16S rRNA (uracil(1498)-N(3))-methyltransferase [Bacteroidales bacterium]